MKKCTFWPFQSDLSVSLTLECTVTLHADLYKFTGFTIYWICLEDLHNRCPYGAGDAHPSVAHYVIHTIMKDLCCSIYLYVVCKHICNYEAWS